MILIPSSVDSQILPTDYLGSGAHIINGTAIVNISSSRLYNIIAAPSYGIPLLEIKASRDFRP